jgi:energy-coupling factor transporter ATP-binding protein EcfA2
MDLLGYIINNFETFKKDIRASCFSDKNYHSPLVVLKNILNSCDENGKLKVSYYRIENRGRLYAENGISYQTMIKEVRGALMKDKYIEVDMVNCQPTILLYLAKKENIEYSALSEYVNNREKLLLNFKDRSQGKDVYLSLTFGGYSNYANSEIKSEHAERYGKEILNIHMLICEKYKEDYDNHTARIKKNKPIHLIRSGFISSILCQIEDDILRIMRECLAKDDNLVNCFDALLLPIRDYDIKKCEKEIETQYRGLNMKLKVKQYDNCLLIPENIPKYIPVVKNNGFIFDDIIRPSFKQLVQLKLLLLEIPVNFYNDKLKSIINACRNWANIKNVADILCEVLVKNNINTDIRNIWNSTHDPRRKKIQISTLFAYHKLNKNKKKLKSSDYFRFKICSSINTLENIDKIGFEIRQINKEYVTNKDGSPDIEGFNKDTFKNKVVVIRSHTGSGKTDLLKYLSNQFDDHTFISLSNRKVLSEYHAKILQCRYYLDNKHKLNNSDMWKRGNDKKGMSCVIDSLVKIKIDPLEKYVLILDETSSLFEYIINEKANMKKIRRHIFNILSYLINNSEYIFCVDADMNSQTLKLLYDMVKIKKIEMNPTFFIPKNIFIETYEDEDIEDIEYEKEKKEIIMFNNNYKCNRCCVMEVDKISELVRLIVKNIEDGERVYICSDKNDYFYNEVFQKLVNYFETKIKLIKKKDRTSIEHKILNDIKNNNFSYYSSDMGNKDDFKNIETLKKRVIFVTPTITTGIDLNFKAHVYGIYYGAHLGAPTVCQQLARIRKPIKIILFFAQSVFSDRYENENELVEQSKIISLELNNILKSNRTNFQIDEIEGNFKNYSDYVNQKFKNIRFHTLDILKKKGHTIIYDSETCDDLLKDVEIIKKEKEIDNDTLKKRFKYICINYGELDKPKMEQLIEISRDDKKFDSFINFRKTEYNTIEDLMHEIDKHDDLKEHKIGARATKIILLKNLLSEMNIKFNNVNYEDKIDKIKKSKKTFNMSESYIKAFKLSRNKYGDRLSHLRAYELVMVMIKNIMPSYVSIRRLNSKTKIKQFHYNIANDQIKVFNTNGKDLN